MKKLAMLAAMMLVAGTAMASNTGFKLNYDIGYDPGTLNNYPVSLPYFYFPAGYPDPDGAVTCSDLCHDAGADLDSLCQWDRANDIFLCYPCASDCGLNDITLDPGAGYLLLPAAAFTFNIVGSHDDEFRPGGATTINLTCAAGTQCNNWVSIPYHSIANVINDTSDVTPPYNGLCQELNSGNPSPPTPVESIGFYDSEHDIFLMRGCGGLGGDDAIIPGQGLVMLPAVASVDIQIETY